MALTKDFSEIVRARAVRDAGFRRELLREAIECLLAGEIGTGKIVLRDYISATIGFERLGELTQIPSKSLMRMFGPKGNPQARHVFDVIGHLQRAEGVQMHVSLKTRSQKPGARTTARAAVTRKAAGHREAAMR